MNYLFLTQSATLSMFFELSKTLRKAGDKDGNTGFYISDSGYYRRYAKRKSDFQKSQPITLKEWDILKKANTATPDPELLKIYEEKYGDPVLWNALVADRRIVLGKRATVSQDYRSRYEYEEMLAVLQTAVEELEALFDRVQPDIVVGFICVTMGEYLAGRIARYRKIPFCNLRPTRIRNYIFAGEDVLEPSDRLGRIYHRLLEGEIPNSLKEESIACLSEVRTKHALYEGVVSPESVTDSSDVPANSLANKFNVRIRKSWDTAMDQTSRWVGRYRYDNSYRGMIFPRWHVRVRAPFRKKSVAWLMRSKMTDAGNLAEFRYAFFPLHKEPEVTLLVYGKPYQNQIEAIRLIARSLPVGMKLVVKEHPAAEGYRKIGYFRKIAAIPNVVFAPTETPSRHLIKNADLVAVIGGSIGLEAIMLKRPLVVLGRVPFAFFPENMVRYIGNPDDLANQIFDLLQKYHHDESTLIAYISAVMETSVPVNLYSTLIGRKGVYRPDGDDSFSAGKKEQLIRLSEYILKYRNEMTRGLQVD